MKEIILREGTLNDNTLYLADEGKIFTGGYIAIIEEWYFLNTQSNRREIKRFKSMKRVYQYINKNYSEEEVTYINDIIDGSFF